MPKLIVTFVFAWGHRRSGEVNNGDAERAKRCARHAKYVAQATMNRKGAGGFTDGIMGLMLPIAIIFLALFFLTLRYMYSLSGCFIVRSLRVSSSLCLLFVWV